MQTNSKKKLQHISKPLIYVQRLNLNRSVDQSDWSDKSDLSDGSDQSDQSDGSDWSDWSDDRFDLKECMNLAALH